MKYLTRTEEMVLLAVLQLEGNAYGVTIRDELKTLSGKTWAFGALFITLDRLSKKGYLDSRLSEPTAERGGRSKRMYELTPAALEALKAVRGMQESLWHNTPDIYREGML